jgi:hypothetical protein
MSNRYVITLALVVVGAFVARLVLPFLPVRRLAVRLSPIDLTLVVVGSLALGFHCGAMFFRPAVVAVPGGLWAIRVIDPMGTPSITWYALAAAVVVVGLRRQHPAALVAAGCSLAAVGYTMYNGGTLRVHLDAIFVAVLLLGVAAAGLALPPWRGESSTSGQAA